MPADGTQELRPTRAELIQVRAYWESKRRPCGGLPGRADIDPLEMRYALGHLVLTDVEAGDPPRFRLRLVGSHVAERMGYDATGRYIDALLPAPWPVSVLPFYRRVVETGAPVLQAVDDVFDERYLKGEILRLPLAKDGKRVDMVLSAAYFGRTA
ncbi:MAG: PAS domain-containing protein [Tagaea sp.]